MRYDRRVLGEQAKKSGFVRDTFEKMVRLTDVLRFIHSEESLRGFLALKGGTAINLTLFDLPRLSVDIDLDMTRNLSIGAVDIERERIAGMLTRYMLANGYKESGKSRRHRILDSLVFVYENAAGHRDSIKLEMNYGLRTHILPVETRRIELPGELGTTDVVTVAPLEIFGSKIVALLTRAAIRDVYDVDSMIRSGCFRNDEFDMLRKCVLFYYAITAESVPETLSDTSEMDLLTRASVRTDLRPVLRTRERFDYRTLEEAKERIRLFLSGYMALTDDERRFAETFRKGEYRPEFLFSDPEILKRVQNHPMALWKTGNKKKN